MTFETCYEHNKTAPFQMKDTFKGTKRSFNGYSK